VQREFQPTVYLLANRRNGAIYTGVTSDLPQRIHQHREGLIPGFTKEHGIKRLVWFEQHSTMEQAILREKRIKKWLRRWKIELIERDNLGWRDLAEDLGFAPLEPTGVPAFAGMTKVGDVALGREHRRPEVPDVRVKPASSIDKREAGAFDRAWATRGTRRGEDIQIDHRVSGGHSGARRACLVRRR
jgi:putative endonuclease